MNDSSPSPGCVTVYVTMPDRQSAEVFCKTLVTERLAACANILDAVASVYWWQGELETAMECACLFKTTAERFPAFLERAKEIHPYEVPCITAWPIIHGHAPYLDWIRAETGGRHGDAGNGQERESIL